MTLKQAIVKQLMQETVGLKLVELSDRVDKRLFDHPNRISTVLTELKNKEHVEKSPGFNNSPSRWRITPQGRAFYSVLNQDNDDDMETADMGETAPNKTEPGNENSAVDLGAQQHAAASHMETDQKPQKIDVLLPADGPQKLAHIAANTNQPMNWVDIEAHDFAVIKFNTTETLDRALYGLVKLIRDVANQEPKSIAIEGKQAAIDLLETMESNPIISGPHRATFARIRSAVAQMEDAA